MRIAEFDLWRPGYGGAEVTVYVAGTTDLADVFLDEALTDAAPNPQTLSSRSDPDGTNYGKFEFPLYVGQPYFLKIEGVEETGIERPPITDLTGEDASGALVTPTGSSEAVPLGELLGRQVFAANYGILTTGESGSADTNTATIALAIAALTNGGEVILPPGKVKVTSLNIPTNVTLTGAGKNATVLESIMGDTSFTLTGNGAGFRKLTLDGNDLTADSLGVYGVGINNVVFEEVKITRFETGLHLKGGSGHVWNDLSLVNMETGAKLHGDLDDGESDNGAEFTNLTWTGGVVSVCSTIGLDLSYEDVQCRNVVLNSVGFENNPGTALNVNGAQFNALNGCWFSGNTVNADIHDDLDLGPNPNLDNDVIGLRFTGGSIIDGEFNATGTLQEVVLDTMLLSDVEFNLNTPLHNNLCLFNCTEYSIVINGEGTKMLRKRETNSGETFGITTSNVAAKGWSIALEPGQHVYMLAKVIGKQRNGTNRANYFIRCGAYRVGATLAYDSQSANFTVGDILTGATSGATARITADSDSGITGTLTLTDIVGTFIDNETITGSTTGSATVNGTISTSNATLDSNGSIHIAAYETNGNWNAAFVANGPEVELRVTGDTNQTVEWTLNVEVTTT